MQLIKHSALSIVFHLILSARSTVSLITNKSVISIPLRMIPSLTALHGFPRDCDDEQKLDGKSLTSVIAGEAFETPLPHDIECIEERQLEHKVQAFAVGQRCRHGFPQAFGFHPIEKKISSGLFRLTCPLLVQAIDKWENEGAVREMSDMVRSSEDMSAKYTEANRRTAAIRRDLIERQAGGLEMVRTKLGEFNAEQYMSSGIAGIPPNQTWDVKCVHAHVADHLCRSNSNHSEGNAIGEEALRKLAEEGINVLGNEDCCQQCDVSRERMSTDWKYVPKKNRQGLRKTRKRRKELRRTEE